MIRSHSFHSTDYHPSSNHSASTPPQARPPKFSVSCVPSPFSRISRYPLSATRTWLTDGPFLRLRRGSPGLSSWAGCSKGLAPPCGDCWTSRTVPVSRKSCWGVSTKQISSRQRIWHHGVLEPLNTSTLLIAFRVRLLRFRCMIYTLSTRLDSSTTTSFDLSAAIKLKYLVFRCARPRVHWITMALQTVKSKNLQQITIHPYATALVNVTEETAGREWQDLDRLLVQFRTSHSVCPKVVYEVEAGGQGWRDCASILLPELTRRGLVDVVECPPWLGP